MTHRAEQIVDAVVSAIRSSAPSTVKVYAHRRLSLAEDQDELPAISVDFGEDQPFDDDGASNMAFIDSLLNINITAIVSGAEERDLKADLLRHRREVHVSLMSDRTLGLGFVVDTRYLGADSPEIDTDGEFLVGSLTSTWAIHYRMNIADPGN